MITKRCQYCKVEFESDTWCNRKYCSKSCSSKDQKIWERAPSFKGIGNKGFSGRLHTEESKNKISESCQGKGRPRDDRIIVNCLNCNKEIEKLQYYIEKRENHFCSQDCWHIYNRGGNHFWYDENSQREYVGFTNELKQTVRLRDSCCQICGIEMNEDESSLSVHHIDCNKENPNPTNLICLCNSCHLRVHHNIKEWTGYLVKIIEDKYHE